MSALALENQERRIGRYRELVSRGEDIARALHRMGREIDGNLVSTLCDIIVRQEIELRQAIEEKNRRPMVVRL